MRMEMRSICQLLVGAAALFLATGVVRADDFVALVQKGNESASMTIIRINMSCAEMLESHERNRKAGTWLTYTPDSGESWRIIWVGCLSATSKMHCPPTTVEKTHKGRKAPTIAGKTAELGKTCE
jgi:hypothetical protein